MFTFLKKALQFLAASCLVSLLGIVILGILSKRFTLHITWTVELAEFLLAWLVMLGGALAYLEHSHLGVDILVSRLEPFNKLIAQSISHLLICLFALFVMVIGGCQLFLERWDSAQMLPTLGIRKAWFYSSVPLVGSLVFVTALVYFFQTIRRSNSALYNKN